jgi:recombination protein RecT
MPTEIQKKPSPVAWIKEPAFLARLAQAIRTDIDPVQLAGIAAMTCQKEPKLLQCTRFSLARSIIECVQLGLEPDGVSGQAYIIPYKTEAKLIIGYRGMIQLGYRFGNAKKIITRNVYENEIFNTDTCEHTPLPPGKRGEWIGSFAKVELNSGAEISEFMWAEEINKIKDAAIAKAKGRSTPWKTDTSEMQRKTAMRRLFKYIPSSPTLQRAVTLDELTDTDEPQFVEPVKTDAELRSEYAVDADVTVHEEIIDMPDGEPEDETPTRKYAHGTDND